MGSTTLTEGGANYPDSNNKLSSAGASASQRHARPQDLPSYPSVGLPHSGRQRNDAAAGAAASLGWANQKPLKIWRPDPSASATTAATVGWNRKAKPSWQPQQSANGARAAVLAAKSDLNVANQNVGHARPKSSTWGNSAAHVAMKNDRRSQQTVPTRASTVDRRGSLIAATGAMASPIRRADSTPHKRTSYPDEMNSRSNALRAATHADSASRMKKSGIPQGGATPVTKMRKDMYSSHPVQQSEEDEKRRSESMHASAIAMAQQMYKIMQKRGEEDAEAAHEGDDHRAARFAQGRQRSTSLMSVEATPMKYGNIQEAAEKLAQERLAKLHDDHSRNREYHDYYGSTPPPKLPYRDRFRRRASSNAELYEDPEQARDIRSQVPLYSSNLSRIDNKTRQHDRDMLLAIAQRNVAKSLQGIDERVYAKTGRMPQTMTDGREARPVSVAQQSPQPPPVEQHDDRIDVGHGAFVGRTSVDDLARRNVQPVLDQIQTQSEAEQARRIEMKLDEEEAKRRMEMERARDMELQEINRQLQEHDIMESKARKSEEKAFKRRSKRMSKQSTKSAKSKSTRSRESSVPEVMTMTGAGAVDEGASHTEQPPTTRLTPTTEPSQTLQPETVEGQNVPEVPVSDYKRTQVQKPQAQPYGLKTSWPPPSSPSSHSGVRAWLRSAFNKTSKGQKEESKSSATNRPFVGGASLGQPNGTPTHATTNNATGLVGTDQEVPVSTFLTDTEGPRHSNQDASNVHTVSNQAGESAMAGREAHEEELDEARDQINDADFAVPVLNTQRPQSPARDSRFREVI